MGRWPKATARLLVLACGLSCAHGFIEELFGQAFGGGGGGFEGVPGGGGYMFQQMGGGGRQQRRAPKWPKGVPKDIEKSMAWLKGTEWSWNDWRNVKFEKDGNFDAPTQECQGNMCKWSARSNKVYILWGDAGVHELNIVGQAPKEQDQKAMSGLKMKGQRVSDREPCSAEFRRVFDHEAAGLEKDLYDILGLPDDAEDIDIKKVYRKLSIKYHPDKNPDEASRKIFNEVRDAYEILNDPDKKILYDTGGMEALKKHEKGEIEKGSDVNAEMAVGLEDLYNGGSLNAKIDRRIVCRGCRVKPDSPKCKGCSRCPNEHKTVHVQVGPGMFMQQQQEVASKEKCKNEGTLLDVQIEKGMRDGESVTFPRMAEQMPGILPGNVILALKMKKHAKFERRGDDLHLSMQVSLREALLGWTQTIQHLDGHTIEIGTSSVTKPFQVFQVKDQGMPLRDDPASFGNLYVKVEVIFPKTLTSAQQQALEGMFEKVPPRPEL